VELIFCGIFLIQKAQFIVLSYIILTISLMVVQYNDIICQFYGAFQFSKD
jgi:hypothetical protein